MQVGDPVCWKTDKSWKYGTYRFLIKSIDDNNYITVRSVNGKAECGVPKEDVRIVMPPHNRAIDDSDSWPKGSKSI